MQHASVFALHVSVSQSISPGVAERTGKSGASEGAPGGATAGVAGGGGSAGSAVFGSGGGGGACSRGSAACGMGTTGGASFPVGGAHHGKSRAAKTTMGRTLPFYHDTAAQLRRVNREPQNLF
jgi:hypothetical protein